LTTHNRVNAVDYGIKRRIAKPQEVALVVATHPFPDYTGDGGNIRRLAMEHRMSPVAFMLHAIATHWPGRAALFQVRRHAVVPNPSKELATFELYKPLWPTIESCTYEPQSVGGKNIGSDGDVVLYRPGLFPDFYDPELNAINLVRLFSHARRQGSILVYSAFDLEVPEYIHRATLV